MTEPATVEEVRMEIRGLMLDPTSNVPIVVLRDEDNQVFLPIWIGVFEANAIALRIENVQPPRPMTHDLLRSALEQVGVKVRKVVISDLQDNTFFALIHVDRSGEELRIDARPSDAIALALRAEVPIYVLRPVLEKAKAVDLASQATDEEKLKKWLEEISPEDLGKYTM
jgi:bifunctional DNase/RNase